MSNDRVVYNARWGHSLCTPPPPPPLLLLPLPLPVLPILFGLWSDFIDIDEWRTSKDVDTPSQIEYASTRLADVSCVRRSAQVISPGGNIEIGRAHV